MKLDAEANDEINFNKILDNFKLLNGKWILKEIAVPIILFYLIYFTDVFIENQDLGNTEQYVIDALNTDSNACLICIETIEAKQPVS